MPYQLAGLHAALDRIGRDAQALRSLLDRHALNHAAHLLSTRDTINDKLGKMSSMRRGSGLMFVPLDDIINPNLSLTPSNRESPNCKIAKQREKDFRKWREWWQKLLFAIGALFVALLVGTAAFLLYTATQSTDFSGVEKLISVGASLASGSTAALSLWVGKQAGRAKKDDDDAARDRAKHCRLSTA